MQTKRRIVRGFAFGFVLALLASGILAAAGGGVVQAAGSGGGGDEGLVAEWRFDEGSGSVLHDSSGNGNDGTIHGATWTEGKFGNALRFDGRDDYVSTPDGSIFGNIPAISISAWVKWDNFNNNYPHIVGTFPNNLAFHGLGPAYGGNQGKVGFYHNGDIHGGGWCDVYTPRLNTGTWYFITVVYDGKNNYMYLNGEEVDSKACGMAEDIGPVTSLWIGTNRHFETKCTIDGKIDEVRIYNRALTAEEIKQHYEGKQPKLTLTKTASPSAIQSGETTTIAIRAENRGTGDAESVEVRDTIPTGFKIISGAKTASFGEIKPGDYRIFEYTLKATGSGKFTCDPATATYKDADGNSYSAASNSVSIQVGGDGEVPVSADSDGDGWSDEKEKEMGTNPYSVDSDGDGLKDPEDPNPTVPEAVGKEKETPGFEAVFAVVAGIFAVAYFSRRRKNGE